MGVAFIIAGFGIYGLFAASKIKKRVNEIRDLRAAMILLEKEITYMHTPLSLALLRSSHLSKASVSPLFTESSRILQDRQGATIQEAWTKGTEELRKSSNLLEEDIEVLSPLRSQLGMSGIEEQRKLFRLIEQELEVQEGRARQAVDSGSKLWSYGGFILGTAIVLLLI